MYELSSRPARAVSIGSSFMGSQPRIAIPQRTMSNGSPARSGSPALLAAWMMIPGARRRKLVHERHKGGELRATEIRISVRGRKCVHRSRELERRKPGERAVGHGQRLGNPRAFPSLPIPVVELHVDPDRASRRGPGRSRTAHSSDHLRLSRPADGSSFGADRPQHQYGPVKSRGAQLGRLLHGGDGEAGERRRASAARAVGPQPCPEASAFDHGAQLRLAGQPARAAARCARSPPGEAGQGAQHLGGLPEVHEGAPIA